MTETDKSRVAPVDDVVSMQRGLLEWFIDRALPFWNEYGVDRECGGFFESVTAPAVRSELQETGAERRGRVVARQIYVFDLGLRLGWRCVGSSPVDHGCDYLFANLYAGDGRWHTSLDPVTRLARAPFSLYEQAFYLFALARLQPTMAARRPVGATALRCLERLRASVGKDLGGFEESAPPSLPLKSNPHMHLLEAALAWLDATDGAAQAPWIALAREIVGLCLTRFMDGSTGAIREYFDYQWNPVAGVEGRIVEPGHQFEWAWLLMQWGSSAHASASERAACMKAADRLVELGERWGVDESRGVAINELWDDMMTKDSAAKLWPQTERIKAWCAMLARARDGDEVAHACGRITAAAQGMIKYLRTDAPGLWHEVCASDGHFPAGPTRASSFYHIACAIDVLTHAKNHLQGAAGMQRAKEAS